MARVGAQAAPTAEDYGGETLADGIRLHGWKFESTEGSIANTADLTSMKTRLQEATGTEELLPKMPEAVFLKNRLTVTHEPSGSKLAFDAESALVMWLKNSLVQGSAGMTIPAAKLGAWQAKVQQKSGETNARPDYDWTYSTDYAGDGADRDSQALGWSSCQEKPPHSVGPVPGPAPEVGTQ